MEYLFVAYMFLFTQEPLSSGTETELDKDGKELLLNQHVPSEYDQELGGGHLALHSAYIIFTSPTYTPHKKTNKQTKQNHKSTKSFCLSG